MHMAQQTRALTYCPYARELTKAEQNYHMPRVSLSGMVGMVKSETLRADHTCIPSRTGDSHVHNSTRDVDASNHVLYRACIACDAVCNSSCMCSTTGQQNAAKLYQHVLLWKASTAGILYPIKGNEESLHAQVCARRTDIFCSQLCSCTSAMSLDLCTTRGDIQNSRSACNDVRHATLQCAMQTEHHEITSGYTLQQGRSDQSGTQASTPPKSWPRLAPAHCHVQ